MVEKGWRRRKVQPEPVRVQGLWRVRCAEEAGEQPEMGRTLERLVGEPLRGSREHGAG